MIEEHPTIFTEANFLLYVMDGDEGAARRLTEGFTPEQMAELHNALLLAAGLSNRILSRRLAEANETLSQRDTWEE